MNVAPGIHAFPQEIRRGETTRTIYPAAVETPKGVVLVDVGDPGELDQIGANLDAIGRSWEDVLAVVLTHQDADHAGTLREVVDRTDAVVYAHENAVPYVDGRKDPYKYDDRPYPPVDVDVEVVDGVSFRTEAGPMDVVFTPGHAPGHVSLHFPDQGVLLAGDAMIGGESRLHGPNERFTTDVAEAVASVEKLGSLAVEQVLCHHGGLVAATGEDVRNLAQSLE